jgi:hypothetical protein
MTYTRHKRKRKLKSPGEIEIPISLPSLDTLKGGEEEEEEEDDDDDDDEEEEEEEEEDDDDDEEEEEDCNGHIPNWKINKSNSFFLFGL